MSLQDAIVILRISFLDFSRKYE